MKLTNVSQRVCYIYIVVFQNVGTSVFLSSEPKKSSSLLWSCWVLSSRSFTPCVYNHSASSALTILHFSLFTSNLGKLNYLSVLFSFTRTDVFTTRLAFKHQPQITLPRREKSALAKRASALLVSAPCIRRTKFQNFNVSRPILYLPSPLKPDVKSRIKIKVINIFLAY